MFYLVTTMDMEVFRKLWLIILQWRIGNEKQAFQSLIISNGILRSCLILCISGFRGKQLSILFT